MSDKEGVNHNKDEEACQVFSIHSRGVPQKGNVKDSASHVADRFNKLPMSLQHYVEMRSP